MDTTFPNAPARRRLLLVIGGGIAAYKVLDLIRRARECGWAVRCVMTQSAQHFITPLSVAALSEEKVFSDLFSLTDEAEMGHIRLSREADLVLVAPCTANLMARMAAGLCDDLATTVLLASDKPILIAPAMNPVMWGHPATQANLATLRARGVAVVGPEAGDMACGEVGSGRLAQTAEILDAAERVLAPRARPLAGRRALVTSGPTRERIDPVRYLSNDSSGRQGHALAAALAEAGADVTLVAGPVALPPPPGVQTVAVESAREMLAACEAALPVDIAVMAAAVADWRPAREADQKTKKDGSGAPILTLVENPDILATLARHPRHRPALVVGFAAETERVVEHARAKWHRKGCDWIVANDVSPGTGTFGGADNRVHLVSAEGVEDWPPLPKEEVARRLVARMDAALRTPAPV